MTWKIYGDSYDSIIIIKIQVSRMADVVRERIQTNRKVETSGVIINTCGWVRGEGYNQIKHVAQAFEVIVIKISFVSFETSIIS